jgi:hypothetical protein
VEVTAHALVGGEVAGYLEELHTQKHGDPCELESCPDGEDDGEGVFEEHFAEVIRENVAFNVLGGFKAVVSQVSENEADPG